MTYINGCLCIKTIGDMNVYTTGTRLLTTCPPLYSCGTASPYWSDDVPPTAVGVPATITAHTSFASKHHSKHKSKQYNRKLQVMRCSLSTPHDFIYKYIPSGVGRDVYRDTCWYAFCGMK